MDLNVLPVWIQGYTGRGVVVSIVDDGMSLDCVICTAPSPHVFQVYSEPILTSSQIL